MIAYSAEDPETSFANIQTNHVDVTGAKLVEVVVRQDGTVLWVNINGVCAMRVCQVENLVVLDDRKKVREREPVYGMEQGHRKTALGGVADVQFKVPANSGPTHAVHQFKQLHESMKHDSQRLGQRFVNRYIKSPWPELFYQKNDDLALWSIRKWLDDNCYSENLPPVINPVA